MRALNVVLSAAIVLGTAGTGLAQTGASSEPATPPSSDPNVQGGAEGDSGAGLEDEARKWIGADVLSSDGKTLGKLKEVLAAAPNSDAGELVVTPPAGGADIEVPIRGASYDGRTVTVTSTEAQALEGSN